MRQEMIVQFEPIREHSLTPPADGAAMPADQARRWLEQQFVANDCEPLRASGKVLTADMVLVLTRTVGEDRFTSDPAWSLDFAHATLAALGRPLVRVDAGGGTISY